MGSGLPLCVVGDLRRLLRDLVGGGNDELVGGDDLVDDERLLLQRVRVLRLEQGGVDGEWPAGHVEAADPVVELGAGGLGLPGDLVTRLPVEDGGVHAAGDARQRGVVLLLGLGDLGLDDLDLGEDLLHLRVRLARGLRGCRRGEAHHDSGRRHQRRQAGTTKSRETSHT